MTEPQPPARPKAPWGRHVAAIYLLICAGSLVVMVAEGFVGRPGTIGFIAAYLSLPWSMLFARFGPELPANQSLAAGLALRAGILALFMLLNAAILAGIARRMERDVRGAQ